MSKTSQERILEEQASRNFDYGKEFRLKVSVDYRLYIFLSPKTEMIGLSPLVDFAKSLPFFEAYRPVYKRAHIIHLYMKFQRADTAKMAIEGFKSQWGPYLHVASVSDMLEAMYTIESSNREQPVWTTAIIDTVGEVRMTDPLHRQVISSMLLRFGDPRIYDLQWEEGRVKSVQALFSSLAEALGASIAFGNWVDDRNPYQNYHYRIRIVGGKKEESIFFQLKIPNAKLVFDMEYFVGGERATHYVPPQLPRMNEMAAELLVQPPNEYHQQNNHYPAMNPPAQRGTHRQRGERRSFPRRQFNNRNVAWQTQPRVQQQETTTRHGLGR